MEAEGLVAMSHFKLHELSGFGGALKNLGMGCASRKGKLSQHSNISPKVTEKKCTGCGDCVVHCAQEAIRINPETEKAVIDPTKCVGCAECISGVPLRQHPDPVERIHPGLPEEDDGIRLRGHAQDKKDRAVFINFITQVSPACDCYGHNDTPHRGGHRHPGLPGPGGHRPGLRRPGHPEPRAPGLRPEGPLPGSRQIQGHLPPDGLAPPAGVRRTAGPGRPGSMNW